MNEDNSYRRFRANPAGKQPFSGNNAKELPINKSPEREVDTSRNVEEMKKGGNIIVAVRSRPLNTKEFSISNFETIQVHDDKLVALLDPLNEFEPEDVFRNNRNREKHYAFDFAFGKDTSTETVFKRSTEFLIEGVLNGYNATIFAYGATGAGKTYTMMGNGEYSGVMGLTLNELFEEIDRTKSDRDVSVRVSYIEVYNENIRDLLSSEDTNLDLREDPVKGNTVAGITEIITTSTPEVLGMLKIGNKNRTIEPTGANEVSSRSHAVLQVVVEHREKSKGDVEEMIVGKLSLIDLAGSERGANTNNRGIRMIEGANINRSLLALGNCITILSEQSEKGGKAAYVPYRDSKLTRLLKDSLGGNCRTVMIACVSPSAASFEDTHNTLKYANRAKNIKTHALRNMVDVSNQNAKLGQGDAKFGQVVANLRNENDTLRKQVIDQKQMKVPIDHNLSVPQTNEKLLKKIQEHFEHELALKKKLFDIETQHDVAGKEIYKLLIDLKVSEDKPTRDRLDAFRQAQKDMMAKIENLQIEYNGLFSRRGPLVEEINNERRESMNYLMSIYKQYHYNVENMEFQHREKQSDNQLKNKDLQIIHLQNQLLLRDELLKDQKNLLDNHKIRHNFNYRKIKSIEAIDEEIKMALPVHKGTSPHQLQKYGNAVQSFPNEGLPHVNSTSNNAALPIMHRAQQNPFFGGKNVQKRVIPIRNSSNDSMDGATRLARKQINRASSNILQPLNHEKDRGQHYFNKQVMYKYRYEKQDVSVRRKKTKIGYLPPLRLNNPNDFTLEKKSKMIGLNSQRRIPLKLNRSVDSGTHRRSETLSDRSYTSTASSNTHKKGKGFAGKPRVRPVLHEVLNDRVMHPRTHIPGRYKESPYVLNFKGKANRLGTSPDETPEMSPGINGKNTPSGMNRPPRANLKK